MSIHISVNRAIQVLLVFLFVLSTAASLYAPVFAVFARSYIPGATLTVVGFAAAVYAVSKSVIQIPIARHLDRTRGERDEFYAMAGGALIGIFFPLLVPFIKTTTQLYVLQGMSGFGDALLMAAYYAMFSHHVDRGREGFEWSLLSVGALTIAGGIGGAYGGIVADSFGFPALFFLSASMNAIGFLMLIFLYPYIKKTDSKIQNVFPQEIPHVSQEKI